MKIRSYRLLSIALVCVLALAIDATLASASDPGNGDWPMWGGTPDRNMVSNLKGMPLTWDV